MAGVDTKTLGAIEREPGPRRVRTLGGLERALGWAEGSVRQVLNGGEPTMTGEYEIHIREEGVKRTVLARAKDVPSDDLLTWEMIDRILDGAIDRARQENPEPEDA
jgi:hypothetical protein